MKRLVLTASLGLVLSMVSTAVALPSRESAPAPEGTARPSQVSADLRVELLESTDVVTHGTFVVSGRMASDWRDLAARARAGEPEPLATRLGETLGLEGVLIPEGDPISVQGDRLRIAFEVRANQPVYTGLVRELRLVTGPAAVAGFLPQGFVPEEGVESTDEPSDHVWQPPFHADVRLHLIVPDGFVPHDRLADEEWRAGPMTVRQRVAKEGAGRLVTISLDTGPARMKSADVKTAQSAWRRYLDEPGPAPSYDFEVLVLRESGRMMEALSRARSLVARNPRSAQKHAFLSTVLLQSGLVAPAREAARQAVALDPKYVFGQKVLADTFGYGSNGEPFGGDFDREALVRERRKALAIEPKAPRPQHELALALARDVHGRFLESTDDLVEIVRLARQATESGWEEARPLLLHALLAAHRYSELEALAREEDNAIDGKHRLAAIAMQRGTAETLRELSTLGPSFGSANAILEQTAVLLWTARLYEQAAPLFAETIRRQPDRASLLSERQAYRRNEALVLDLRRPEDVVRAVKQSCVDLRRFVAERGRLLGETLFEGELEDRDRTAYRSTCGTPVGVTSRAALFVDGSLVGSLAGSGDRRSGFQVEQGREGARDEAPRKYFFVMPDRNGRLQLVAADTAEAGREALRQLEAGRMEAAARLVDMGVAMLTTMLRRYKEAGTPDAALSARIVRLRVAWPAVGAPARRDPEALRAAGAMLAGPRFRKLTIPLLEKAFARATGPMRDALGEDLLPQLYAEERFADVVKVIEQLSPESRASFLVHQAQLKALAKLGRDRELDAVVADWRRRGFEEGLVERLLAEHEVETDRLEAAVARLERLVRSPDGEALDHNNLAWYLFALGKDRARAVSLARRSIELSKLRETNRLNTLACALADAGQLDEAIKLTRETRDTPAADPSALSFVLGILAEKMGLPDEARRQYQRAAEGKRRHGPERKSDVPALARARLARLPAP